MSIINYQASQIDNLLVPQGILLGSSPNLSIEKSKLAYNLTDDKLYVCNGVSFQSLAGPIYQNIGSTNFVGAGAITLNMAVQKMDAFSTISFSQSNSVVAVNGTLAISVNLPADFRPTSTRSILINCINNGVYTVGGGRIGSSGIIVLGKGFDSSGALQNFDAGTLVILDCSCTYYML